MLLQVVTLLPSQIVYIELVACAKLKQTQLKCSTRPSADEKATNSFSSSQTTVLKVLQVPSEGVDLIQFSATLNSNQGKFISFLLRAEEKSEFLEACEFNGNLCFLLLATLYCIRARSHKFI